MTTAGLGTTWLSWAWHGSPVLARRLPVRRLLARRGAAVIAGRGLLGLGAVRLAMAGHDSARHGSHGLASSVKACLASAGQDWAWRAAAAPGSSWQGSHGEARLVAAGRGKSRRGAAWQSRCGRSSRGLVRRLSAAFGPAGQRVAVMAWPVLSRRGGAWPGLSRCGMAGHGSLVWAGSVRAGLCRPRLGAARRGSQVSARHGPSPSGSAGHVTARHGSRGVAH